MGQVLHFPSCKFPFHQIRNHIQESLNTYCKIVVISVLTTYKTLQIYCKKHLFEVYCNFELLTRSNATIYVGLT